MLFRDSKSQFVQILKVVRQSYRLFFLPFIIYSSLSISFFCFTSQNSLTIFKFSYEFIQLSNNSTYSSKSIVQFILSYNSVLFSSYFLLLFSIITVNSSIIFSIATYGDAQLCTSNLYIPNYDSSIVFLHLRYSWHLSMKSFVLFDSLELFMISMKSGKSSGQWSSIQFCILSVMGAFDISHFSLSSLQIRLDTSDSKIFISISSSKIIEKLQITNSQKKLNSWKETFQKEQIREEKGSVVEKVGQSRRKKIQQLLLGQSGMRNNLEDELEDEFPILVEDESYPSKSKDRNMYLDIEAPREDELFQNDQAGDIMQEMEDPFREFSDRARNQQNFNVDIYFNTEERSSYNRETREDKLNRYRMKKLKRVWKKHVAYKCRQNVANHRPRVKGRFVSKKQILEVATQQPKKDKEQPAQSPPEC